MNHKFLSFINLRRLSIHLTLFSMYLFGAAHGWNERAEWGWAKKAP